VKLRYVFMISALLSMVAFTAVLVGPPRLAQAAKGAASSKNAVAPPKRPIPTTVEPGVPEKDRKSHSHGHHNPADDGKHQNDQGNDNQGNDKEQAGHSGGGMAASAPFGATPAVGGSGLFFLNELNGVLKSLLRSLIPPASPQNPPPSLSALVLYDAPPSDPYTNLGFAYAIMLQNLLGHFNASVDLVPIQNYTAGKLSGYQATFYIGAYYANPIPTAFFVDVTQTQNTVVWFKYNLWEMAWDSTYNFNQRYGFAFNGLRGMDAQPTAQNPNPGFFDTVLYKNKSMVKYYSFDATTGTISADPDLGVTQVLDATKAQALVTITDSHTNEVAPYIVRSGNFWYVADMPFSYIGPRDRYLAICDILHDVLGVTHTTAPRALVRLEDVNATTTVASMRSLTNYLRSKNIPFSIATIPFYRDPLGRYNGGVPEEIHMANATNLKTALNYALLRGGKILMHGYTHQYDSTPDLNTAVSADDFEFWYAVENRPVNEDSTAWAAGRLQSGLTELKGSGYTPFAWEAPHYQSSPLSIRAVPPVFSSTYQRAVYYTSDNPNFSSGPGKDFEVGQFYPYIVSLDYYGQRVLPENLGNVEYNICNIDPYSCTTYTWQDIYTNAQYAQVVRDGFASFFFHPFWLEPEIGTPGLADFQSLVQAITGLGYQWVDASTAQ
jgi:uncharacterized protein YdaL